MIGLTNLEGYNFIIDFTEEENKIELYTDDSDDESSFNELRDKVAEVLGLSDMSPDDLQHEIIGPDIIKTYRKLSMEKSHTDGNYILIMHYAKSPVRDLESFLRNLTGLHEDDIQLKLKQYNSKFITYRISPGIYTFTDLAELLSRGFKSDLEIGKLRPNHIHDRSSSFIIEIDNITIITKLFLRYEIRVLRFVDKSFFNTMLSFSPFWDYKNDNEDFSEKIRKLNIINKIQLKRDCFVGSVLNGVRQPILYNFVLDKPPGYKMFCDPETIQYKKINVSVLNTIIF